MADKPKNIEEYKKWYKDKFKEEIMSYESVYNTAALHVVNTLQTSELIVLLNNKLEELRFKYYTETKAENLYSSDSKLIIESKPFESLISKSFRKNVLFNKNFPDSPQVGWINHNSWYEYIDDLFRGIIYVKYLDGVKFLVNELEDYCKQNNIKFKNFYEARDGGYYGAHVYIESEVLILNKSWNSELKKIKIEIQITTELKGLIKELLHTYYETNRDHLNSKNALPWQWEYECNEFDANYLGHLIHNIEASILKVRNKIKEEKL